MSLAAVDTAAGTGLPDLDFAQLGQRRLEALPDPAGDIFTGWIFQAFYLVEVVVVQLVVDRFKAFLHLPKVHYPAAGLWCSAANRQSHVKRMSVQTGAFMPLGNIGQAMCRLEVKFLVDFHAVHRAVRASSGLDRALRIRAIEEDFTNKINGF